MRVCDLCVCLCVCDVYVCVCVCVSAGLTGFKVDIARSSLSSVIRVPDTCVVGD